MAEGHARSCDCHTAGMGTAVALGTVTGLLLMTDVFTFGLAGLIGYRIVRGIAHSPLISGTNVISGESHPW